MGMIYQRGKTFWIKYYRNGKPYRESTRSWYYEDAVELLKAAEDGKLKTKKPQNINNLGYIYVVADKELGLCKIGFTSVDVKSRVKAIQTSYPFKLDIIRIFKNQTTKTEAKIHDLFRDLNINNEWFYFPKEMAMFFKRCGEPNIEVKKY